MPGTPGTPTIRRRLDHLLTASLGALLAVALQAVPPGPAWGT